MTKPQNTCSILLIGFFLILPLMNAVAQENQTESKEEKREREYNELVQLVESGQFEFVGERAFPQRGPQVDITTRNHLLKIEGNHAIGDLSYFGRSYSGGYYNSNGGVKFDGEMESHDVSVNDKKYRITVKFRIRGSDDTYNCILTISGYEAASLSVTSNNKSPIRYTGNIKSTDDSEEID